MKQSSVIIGLAAGVALGLVGGFMMFDRRVYGQVMKKLNKTRRALKRQQAEWRETAGNVLESGREQVDFVRDKGRRANELVS